MAEQTGPVVVVGAGPVGCVLAALLAKRGHEVTVYEKRDDMRRADAVAGRSINLVLTARGLRGLELLGLKERVLELTVPVLGRMMHSVSGELTYQPYGKDSSECNYSVSRGQLNEFLLDEAERAGAVVHFQRELIDADLETGLLTLRGPEGEEQVSTARVFGADGAPSGVRAALAQREGAHVSMDLLSHGYKELLFLAGGGGEYAIDGRALHIWPRGHHMLMALANLDGSFTGTIYLPNEGADSFAELSEPAAVEAFFSAHYPDAIPLLAGDYAQELVENPVGVLGTVRCQPWYLDDRALLIGDAAHAIVPFFGQGLNCGLEDCAVLSELFESEGETARVFAEFGRRRKPNGDAIAEMALENFVEMRDRVADPAFLLRKRVENLLENAFPTAFRSRYAIVMYSSIPYAHAQEAGRIHDRILGELCQGIQRAEDVDLARAEALIAAELTPFHREHKVDLDF